MPLSSRPMKRILFFWDCGQNSPSQTTVRLRVALSNVDLEGAKKNFEVEHTGFDIEQDQKWQNKNGSPTSMP